MFAQILILFLTKKVPALKIKSISLAPASFQTRLVKYSCPALPLLSSVQNFFNKVISYCRDSDDVWCLRKMRIFSLSTLSPLFPVEFMRKPDILIHLPLRRKQHHSVSVISRTSHHPGDCRHGYDTLIWFCGSCGAVNKDLLHWMWQELVLFLFVFASTAVRLYKTELKPRWRSIFNAYL